SVLLPKTMLALNREFPELSTRMIEAEPAECYDLILAGEADMGIVVLTSSTPPQSDARFEQRHLIDDPLDLMVPLGHRLAERSRVSLADAAGERWIVGRPGTTYYQLVMGSCTAAGFTPDIAHHADEWETGTALVADGFGVCLVSRLAQWPDNHPVMRIPLRGAHTPARRVVVVTRAGAQGRKSIELALSVLTQTAGRLMYSLRADLGGWNVREAGLEPSRPKAQESISCAAANYATRARPIAYWAARRPCHQIWQWHPGAGGGRSDGGCGASGAMATGTHQPEQRRRTTPLPRLVCSITHRASGEGDQWKAGLRRWARAHCC